jgi:hypothetical protein
VLSLAAIQTHIAEFLSVAKGHPHLEFLVTKIGCGEAGYNPAQIATCFSGMDVPANVILPAEFVAALNHAQAESRPRDAAGAPRSDGLSYSNIGKEIEPTA